MEKKWHVSKRHGFVSLAWAVESIKMKLPSPFFPPPPSFDPCLPQLNVEERQRLLQLLVQLRDWRSPPKKSQGTQTEPERGHQPNVPQDRSRNEVRVELISGLGDCFITPVYLPRNVGNAPDNTGLF